VAYLILCVWLLVFAFMLIVDRRRRWFLGLKQRTEVLRRHGIWYRGVARIQVGMLSTAVMVTLFFWGIGVLKHLEVPREATLRGNVFYASTLTAGQLPEEYF